jgi:N-acetylglucosamine transport system substrate-binding protein
MKRRRDIMKKALSILLVMVLIAGLSAGCQNGETSNSGETVANGNETSNEAATDEATDATAGDTEESSLTVAAIETAYGAQMWTDVAAAFEAVHPGVSVELIVDKNLEDVISPSMKAGDYPDVVHLGVGRPAALTETLIKEQALLDITDVLSMTIPGEDITVSDKLIPGFTSTRITNPYGDGQTYLAPMFYSPCGLFYNAALFEEKGWDVPTTWDEMWTLGDKAEAEGIALFTYPTTGYFDALFYGLLNVTGGPALFNAAMTYEEGIWTTDEAQKAFDIVEKLAAYTEATTPANANNENYLKNQQLILDNEALFMPNGTWVTGEMADAPRVENFEWGFTALPALDANSDQYSYTFFEQAWVPAAAKNPDLAKEFISFLYSDQAAAIFASSNAVQPIFDMTEYLSGENQLFYSVYNDGAKAAMGNFAATEPVEGVNMADTLFGTVDSLVTGDKTRDEWVASVIEASERLREALK